MEFEVNKVAYLKEDCLVLIVIVELRGYGREVDNI